MKKTAYFKSSDGKNDVFYCVWEPDGEIRFTVQLIHGMTEFIDRYETLAEYLCSQGAAVIGHDHIGHGHSAKPEDYGYFGAKDGHVHLVDDVGILHGIIAAEYPGLPHFIMGHSMGSFVLRSFLSRYGGKDLSGAVIEGTSGKNPATGIGIAFCGLIAKLCGPKRRSDLINDLAFGSYNRRIKDPKSKKDWVCSDAELMARYTSDPMCGFTFTVSAYRDMFRLLRYISSEDAYRAYPAGLPTLFISGAEDPVGAYGKGPTEVVRKLREHGAKDVSLILYENMRHEVHNEIGKEKVYEDIWSFITEHIEQNGEHRQ